MAAYNIEVLNETIGNGFVSETLKKAKEERTTFEEFMLSVLESKIYDNVDRMIKTTKDTDFSNISNIENHTKLRQIMSDKIDELVMEMYKISNNEEPSESIQQESIRLFARHYKILP